MLASWATSTYEVHMNIRSPERSDWAVMPALRLASTAAKHSRSATPPASRRALTTCNKGRVMLLRLSDSLDQVDHGK
jgi:hypothetical protein